MSDSLVRERFAVYKAMGGLSMEMLEFQPAVHTKEVP